MLPEIEAVLVWAFTVMPGVASQSMSVRTPWPLPAVKFNVAVRTLTQNGRQVQRHPQDDLGRVGGDADRAQLADLRGLDDVQGDGARRQGGEESSAVDARDGDEVGAVGHLGGGVDQLEGVDLGVEGRRVARLREVHEIAERDLLQVGDEVDRDVVDLGRGDELTVGGEGLAGGGEQVGHVDVGGHQLVGGADVVAHGQQLRLQGLERDTARRQAAVADRGHVHAAQHRADDGVERRLPGVQPGDGRAERELGEGLGRRRPRRPSRSAWCR